MKLLEQFGIAISYSFSLFDYLPCVFVATCLNCITSPNVPIISPTQHKLLHVAKGRSAESLNWPFKMTACLDCCKMINLRPWIWVVARWPTGRASAKLSGRAGSGCIFYGRGPGRKKIKHFGLGPDMGLP